MENDEPFSSHSLETTLLEIVKNLEKRWGLTLVSFLPSIAHKSIKQLQVAILNMLGDQNKKDIDKVRASIKFYEPQNFHCTHFTLKRSTPIGPIEAEAFVKNGHKLFELYKIISRATAQIRPMKVKLDRMALVDNGLGIILVGECVDDESVRHRQKLLTELNTNLPRAFNISTRSGDLDFSRFHILHSTLGYIKRPLLQQEYRAFVEKIKNYVIDPIIFRPHDVQLVHHRYRSLEFPQEGIVSFPFGEKLIMRKTEFIQRLNLF